MQTEYQQAHHHQANFDEENLAKNLHGKARMGFVRKVYGIVCAELVFTAIWVTIVYNSPALTRFVVGSTGLGYLFAFVSFVGTLLLALSQSFARTVPGNYIVLGAVTFSTAWSVSFLCSFFPASSVLMAAFATASAVSGITWYSFTSTADYHYGRAFAYSSLAILAFQLIAIFFMPIDAYNFAVSVLFAISTSISILYHAEAIFGKKGFRYTQDDYICAAMNLYIEIIQLFIELLRIIDKLNKDSDKDKKKKKD